MRPLTPEEEQFIRDIGNDALDRYPAYSSPVDAAQLLGKLTEQFNAVPSYVERFAREAANEEKKPA